MNIKDPKIRLIIMFTVVTFILLYRFYSDRRSQFIIPTTNAVYASPQGGEISFKGKKYTTLKLDDAFSALKTGGTVFLFAGEYNGHWSIESHATESHPTSIRGVPDAVFTSGEHCLTVKNSQWVFIEDLNFSGCAQSAIRMIDSTDIFASKSQFSKNQTDFLLTGAKTKNLVFEKNTSKDSFSFLIAKGISGDIAIRKNHLSGNQKTLEFSTDLDGLPLKNIQILQNSFTGNQSVLDLIGRIDNFWFYENTLKDNKDWFSLKNIRGRDLKFFSNTGFQSRSQHTDSSVFQWTQDENIKNGPIYIFHNTWLFSGNYIRATTSLKNIRHFNNILISSKENYLSFESNNWDPSNKVDYDLLSAQPSAFTKKNGLWGKSIVGIPEFINADEGNYSLKPKGPGYDGGVSLKFPGWESQYYGEAPDMGAFEGGVLVKGPPYSRQ